LATIANEPHNAVTTLLRAKLTDYNSARRKPAEPGSNWIFPDYPIIDLVKNSYPMIRVNDVTETAEIVDINRTMVYHPRIQIDVFVWLGIDGADRHIITISGVNYSGKKLLDMVSRDVISALDDNKADFDDDTNILHNLKLLAKVDMGKDPDRKQLIRKRIEISFDYYRG